MSLALHLLNDAWQDAYDCGVVVSNDPGLAEAMRLVKAQHSKVLDLITPGAPVRKTSTRLKQYADGSQLPSPIPRTTITKPASW